jgi:hypothetical protein
VRRHFLLGSALQSPSTSSMVEYTDTSSVSLTVCSGESCTFLTEGVLSVPTTTCSAGVFTVRGSTTITSALLHPLSVALVGETIACQQTARECSHFATRVRRWFAHKRLSICARIIREFERPRDLSSSWHGWLACFNDAPSSRLS